ncbi:MAG: hypothetical protein IPG67_14840 [Acidobacteria bacterium]|nr:hypothetical protein [Acidobacteriota bacterium]
MNELPLDEAEYVFRECCGSSEWPRGWHDHGLFPMLDHLFVRADEIWAALSPAGSVGGNCFADDDIDAGVVTCRKFAGNWRMP